MKTVQVHVVKIIEDKYLHIALKRKPNEKFYPNIWQTITGTIEPNENALQTALRELKEETSLTPLKIWNIPVMTSFYDVRLNSVHFAPNFGVLVAPYSKVKLSEEHDEYKWLSIEEVKEIYNLPTHVSGAETFEKYVLNKNAEYLEFKI